MEPPPQPDPPAVAALPHRGQTELLDALAELDAPATFFLVGRDVDANPAVVARMVAEGHELGNHTFTHPGDLATLDEAVIREEIDRAQSSIRETAGVEPVLWRTPFLRTSDHLLSVVSSLGLTHVGCSVMPGDWELDADEIAERVRPFLRPGAVIVLHDGRPADEPPELSRPTREETSKATGMILADMSRLGLRAVTVSELVAAD